MINTEFFEHSSQYMYYCCEETIEDVNDFISKNNIKREDIIEYKTETWESENWVTETNCYTMYNYKVTMTYWK